MMERVAQWIDLALDRLEIEPEEVQELTVRFPGAGDIATVRIGEKEVFLWGARTPAPYAYWTNDYDEIAREYAAEQVQGQS